MTSLLLTSIILSLGQAPRHDFHLIAVPLERVLSEVNSAYGTKLICNTPLRSQIMLVEAKQATEQALRDKIAVATNSLWEQRGSEWHLISDPKAIVRRNAALKNAQKFILQRYFKKTIEGAKLDQPCTVESEFSKYQRYVEAKEKKDEDAMDEYSFFFPENRLVAKFLSKLGIDRILSILPGQRMVFAANANQSQVPLGFDVSTMIDQYHQDQATQEAVFKKYYGEPGSYKVTSQGKEIKPPLEARMSFENGRGPISNVLFTVYCDPQGMITFDLIGLSKSPHDFGIKVSMNPGLDAFLSMFTQTGGNTESKGESDNGFKPSEIAQDLHRFYYNNTDQISPSRLKLLDERIMNPVNWDPLGLSYADLVLYEGIRLKQNIVAALSDDELVREVPLNLDVDSATEGLFEQPIFDDGWLVLPVNIYGSLSFPRDVLKGILQRTANTHRFSLEDKASIRAWMPRSDGVSQIEGLIDPLADDETLEEGEYDAVRLLGLMSPSQIEQAGKPEGIAFTSLTSRAQRHLSEVVFWNESSKLSSLLPPEQQSMSAGADEPTILLPNGIPPDARLTFKPRTFPVGLRTDLYAATGAISVKELGQLAYHYSHLSEYSDRELFPFNLNTLIKVAKETSYEVTLHLNSLCSWQSEFHKIVVTDSKPFTVANIPTDMKEEFQAGYDKEAAGAAKRIEQTKKRNQHKDPPAP